MERRVVQASYAPQHRDALLDRAAFYLLWQAGLRLGEVEELRLDDLNLSTSLKAGLLGRKLAVRNGKGLKDRAVYLTPTTVRALQAYLDARGMGPTDHILLYRNRAISKDLLQRRVRYTGQRTGVKVTPHRLRHTCATQLLNAGCRVTSIQKLLGHRRLNSTMVYARVHDRTVAEDYYTAMEHIEKSLDTATAAEPAYTHLLTLVDTLQSGPLTTGLQETVQVLCTEILALNGSTKVAANGSSPIAVGEKT